MSREVLFICDDPETDPIWIYLLHRARLKVEAARSRQEAFVRLKERGFDLVLINANGSGGDWIDFCRRLRGNFVNPILFMTSSAEEAFAVAAYKVGVDECIRIPIGHALYAAKVRAWLRRVAPAPAGARETAEAGQFQLDPVRRQLTLPNSSSVKLANQEAKLFELLLRRRGQVLAAAEILESVWGYDEADGRAVLKNVVYRLRRKIEPDPNRPTYLQTVAGEGYRFQSP